MGTQANYKANIRVFRSAEDLAFQSLQLFVGDAQRAVEQKGVFYTAISGGNTPRRFFEMLGELTESRSLPWDKIHLFWVDERYVPADSEFSNYRLAADTFLGRVGIPKDNVHRILTEYCDFATAARQYEEVMRTVFGLEENQVPQFDLVVLGMGVEGHTGSLFPDSYASFDKDDLACVVYALDGGLDRITLTHPVLCAATRLAVLVSGQEKAAILKKVLMSEPDEIQYPIHVLWPVLDRVLWLADEQAAKLL